MARGRRIQALGLAGLALSWWIGTGLELGAVESDLTRRAAAALGAAGLDSPALLVAGRDAAISGAASSAGARRGAVEAVAGVRGVRKVDAALVWIKPGANAEPPAPASRTAPAADFLPYDFTFLWPWLLPAAILGAAAARSNSGDAAVSGRRGRRLAFGLGAASIALAIVLAATRWPPGRPGFWSESAALFLAAYLVGGFAGECFSRLREKVARSAG